MSSNRQRTISYNSNNISLSDDPDITYDAGTRATDHSGELEQTEACKRLFAAKLIMHARDYAAGAKMYGGRSVESRRNSGDTHSAASKAIAWIDSPYTSPASFIWTCELFGLDPMRVRNKIIFDWRSLLEGSKRFKSNREDESEAYE